MALFFMAASLVLTLGAEIWSKECELAFPTEPSGCRVVEAALADSEAASFLQQQVAVKINASAKSKNRNASDQRAGAVPKVQTTNQSMFIKSDQSHIGNRTMFVKRKRTHRKQPHQDEHPLTRDIIPSRNRHPEKKGYFFDSADAIEWRVLALVTVGLCLLDYFVIQALIPDTFLCHLCAIAFWIAVAGGYNLFVWKYRGHKEGVEWLTGYFLEWILSMDNLFVFTLIFEAYKTPKNQIHKAVFVGIIGAVLMRLVFFLTLSSLLNLFDWIRFLFGAFLIWSGIEAVRSDDDGDDDVTQTRLVKGLKWLLNDRLQEEYCKEASMFVWSPQGHLQVTVLFIVIWCLEVTDIVFAVDSVSAKISQIPQEYIAFSSSVLAMFGLRATFFIVHDMVQMFELLKYGLCIILVFIGLELMFSHWLHLSSGTVCILILCVFITSIVASLVKPSVKAITSEDETRIRNN